MNTKYDNTKYKIKTWKNPDMLFWIINPGIIINELIFGQRVPKVMLIDRESDKPLSEKTHIPCPHCGTLHANQKWTPQNKTAYGNWFGLYCDHCKNTIPCLRNLTSFLFLVISAPIWYWFKDLWKKKWLEAQKIKFSQPLILTQAEFDWRKIGLSWGFDMYIFMTILFPLITQEEISKSKLLIGIPTWAMGGLLFGLITKRIGSPKKSNPKTSE